MSYTRAVLIVLLGVLASALFSYMVHRFVAVDVRRRHQDVGVAVFLQLGVLFSVLLAFVFSEVYSEYGAAQQAIDLECGALHGASMLATTLPAEQAQTFLTLEAKYIEDVVSADWPVMRRRRRGSEAAAASLMHLVAYAARLAPGDAAQLPVKSQILNLLATGHAQREVRLFQSGNGLPIALWTVLIGLGLALTAFVAFSSVERYAPLTLFGAIFALCIGSILELVALLNYPFEGALALKPDDFVATLHKVAALLQAV